MVRTPSQAQRNQKEPRGDNHQHQLEIFWGSQLPKAGKQFDPMIGRIQQTAGPASSASAGNDCGLTTQSPGLSTHGRLAWTHSANRGASIISISWKSFWTHTSISGSFNPQQGSCWTLSLDGCSETRGRASSASAGNPFGLTLPISGLLNLDVHSSVACITLSAGRIQRPSQFRARASSASAVQTLLLGHTTDLQVFQPQGEHHPASAGLNLRVLQPPSRVAV